MRARSRTRRATNTSTRRKGRSVQQAVFLDSTGRAYSLVAHSLPSARGLGEPLSSRVDPPDGAKWRGVMIGEPEDLWLVASDAGYGFTVRLKEAYAQQEGRQDAAQHSRGALVLPPAPVPGDDALVAVTSEGGKLLVFPVKDVPELRARQGQQAVRHPVEEIRSRAKTSSPAWRWCRRTSRWWCAPAIAR